MSGKTLLTFYVGLNAIAILGCALVGACLLATAGEIPGYAGTPAELVFWHAVGSTLFTATSFGVLV